MWGRVKIELIIIIPFSILIGFIFQALWNCPLALTVIGALGVNLILLGCLWYGDKVNRPILWQMLMILLLGIAATCLSGWGIKEILENMGYELGQVKSVGALLLIDCLLTTFLERKTIRTHMKKRVDLWLPPLWSVAIAVGLLLLMDVQAEQGVRQWSIVSVTVVLLLGVFSKYGRRMPKEIDYQIERRSYVKALFALMIGAMVITVNLPVRDSLPGTKWVQKQFDNIWTFRKPINASESKLSRNPSQSQGIVLTMTASEKLYLRRRAYTTYNEGLWTVEEEKKNVWRPFKGESLYSEYTLLTTLLEELEAGTIELPEFQAKYDYVLSLPLATKKYRYAKIKEEDIPLSYLSVNGISKIELNEGAEVESDGALHTVNTNIEMKVAEEQSKVGYIGMLENLYFASLRKQADQDYTIGYDYYDLAGTREYALLKRMSASELIDIWEQAYPQSTTIRALYKERANNRFIQNNFYKSYTQIPEEIHLELQTYANEIIKGARSQLEQAQAISDELKYRGGYTYKVGARYENNKVDPVIDFLFYGKKGICQDFASSMVLLCRSIGLPARYVTGYYATEQGDNLNEYIIREKDAHAFVEVYITGYGWMLFDPTTAVDEELEGMREVVLGKATFVIPKLSMVTIIITLLVAFLAWKYPLTWLTNKAWAFLILHSPPDKGIKRLMSRTLHYLERKGYEQDVDETLSQLTNRLRDQEIEIGEITSVFEAYYYGGQVPTRLEVQQAYNSYERLRHHSGWKKHQVIR